MFPLQPVDGSSYITSSQIFFARISAIDQSELLDK